MTLLAYGCGRQLRQWHVDDGAPSGYCRVYYIREGSVHYSSGGMGRELYRGRIYIFPSVTPYTISHDPFDPIDCLWFHIDLFPTQVKGLIEIVPDTCLQALLTALESEVCTLGTQRINERWTPYLNSLCQSLVLWCRDRDYLPEPPRGKLQPMLQFVEEHCRTGVTLRQLSERFGYSEEHMIRLFHKNLGMTPHQYLVGCRMNLALQLLQSDLSISQIAVQSGYPDGKRFSDAFRKRYGVSPTMYRRMIWQP